MDSLACMDCDDVPEQESTWVHEIGRTWIRRRGGRCWSCHQERTERLEREAEEQLETARAANSARGCSTATASAWRAVLWLVVATRAAWPPRRAGHNPLRPRTG
ncbi:hypothetical protein ACFC1R_32560 [Kitasatospora sp. NPDC056138]|uniref:hypothetical protein n=1 Tax=Kitasatospora sp. NPDC056138 TaxID=3345724 RepID=UPI0035E185DB